MLLLILILLLLCGLILLSVPVLFWLCVRGMAAGYLLAPFRKAQEKAKININNIMEELKCTIPTTEWIHLHSGKEFSRLLYTNPVCFLASTSSQSFKNADRDGDRKASAKKNDPSTHNNIQRNVMVLSWLTASNNNGRFLFSINKSRYSTQLVAPLRGDESDSGGSNFNYETGVEFSLSVPVKGMEEMVRDVGSFSGRVCSKFQSDTTSLIEEGLLRGSQLHNLSNRQRKKQKNDNIKSNGILGLLPVPLGNGASLEEFDLFAIKGTVAHLRCRAYAVIGSPSSDNLDATNEKASGTNRAHPVIDDDHLLIMAEVVDAFVHPSYWDSNKLLFRPMARGEQTAPPYLTFFGSQTFGYVVPSCDDIII
jgi:flavin reductase (DIM6/NTAB) family NADH-FMN oxidoreductase RutF